MTAPFDCAFPRRILHGKGRVGEIAGVIRGFGERCLVFCGRGRHGADPVREALDRDGIQSETLSVAGEPTFESVRSALDTARLFSPDVVVSVGGGSVIDAAKAVAMLLGNGGDPMDYAEVIGRGQPIEHPSTPLIAVPTTSGTGSEATRNAVIKHPGHGVKVSLRHATMIPDTVILDPDMTMGLPPSLSAATGMDALCQLIEAFACRRANPWTDSLCRAGIPLAARALPRVCAFPDDAEARFEMMLAACWSGVALANAGLGAVHGFAAVLGGLTDAAHGRICAALLAPVCRANIEALAAEGTDNGAAAKFRELAAMLTGRSGASAHDGPDWIEQLVDGLPLDPLDIPMSIRRDDVVSGAMRSSSMRGNPVDLSESALSRLWNDIHGQTV